MKRSCQHFILQNKTRELYISMNLAFPRYISRAMDRPGEISWQLCWCRHCEMPRKKYRHSNINRGTDMLSSPTFQKWHAFKGTR